MLIHNVVRGMLYPTRNSEVLHQVRHQKVTYTPALIIPSFNNTQYQQGLIFTVVLTVINILVDINYLENNPEFYCITYIKDSR